MSGLRGGWHNGESFFAGTPETLARLHRFPAGGNPRAVRRTKGR